MKNYILIAGVNDVLRAGEFAVKKIDQYLESGVSFNQETTLCGKTIIQNIKIIK